MVKSSLHKIKSARQGLPWVVSLCTGEESDVVASEQMHPAVASQSPGQQDQEQGQQEGSGSSSSDARYFYGWDGGVKKAWRMASLE